MSDPMLPPGTRFCKCGGCGEYFSAEKAFAMHRKGEPDKRFCLTPRMMSKRGMVKNDKGYWMSRARQHYDPYGPTTNDQEKEKGEQA